MKIIFFFFFFLGGGSSQGECERRIEVFVKIHKKNWGGGGGVGGDGQVGGWVGGVRVDVNEELKFLGKFTKNIGGRKGVRWGGSGWWGVKVDVNAMLGVGGVVGYGDVNQE